MINSAVYLATSSLTLTVSCTLVLLFWFLSILIAVYLSGCWCLDSQKGSWTSLFVSQWFKCKAFDERAQRLLKHSGPRLYRRSHSKDMLDSWKVSICLFCWFLLTCGASNSIALPIDFLKRSYGTLTRCSRFYLWWVPKYCDSWIYFYIWRVCTPEHHFLGVFCNFTSNLASFWLQHCWKTHLFHPLYKSVQPACL